MNTPQENYEGLRYVFEKLKSEQSVLAKTPMFNVFHDNLPTSHIKYDKWLISYCKDCITVSEGTLANKQFVCYGVQQLLVILRAYDQLEILKF